jgi:phytoene dehydrogenase-like protein
MNAERRGVVIVGAGLAGLACARTLTQAGESRPVHVIEAGDGVGGRARTRWIDGLPIDHGFQVGFRGYRTLWDLARGASIPAGDLRTFGVGTAVHDGSEWRRFGLVPPRFAGLPSGDIRRLAALMVEVRRASPERMLAEPIDDMTTEEYLVGVRGVSRETVNTLVRPLFSGIFLDRSLRADAGYFRYLLAVMSRGPAILPTDGLGQVAEWLAAVLRRDGVTITTSSRVAEVLVDEDRSRAIGVRTVDGAITAATTVVLAVEGGASRTLLTPLDPLNAQRIPSASASMLSAAFRMRRPLYQGRTLLLNAAPMGGDEPRVDLLCQTSNVNRPGAGDDHHVLMATAVTTESPMRDDDLPEAVASLVKRWSPDFPWDREATLIEVRNHPGAQFRPLPGVRRSLPGVRTAIPNLLLAGDYTCHPSLEGAVSSGIAAATAIRAQTATP